MTKVLDSINSPVDLKKLQPSEKLQLCNEIRDEMVEIVSQNGGHLASNLGVVELTVALLSAFNVPSDTIIFDVGHQCYPYKMLTGRKEEFSTLRKENGISGFPKPSESIFDSFIEGHASTSIAQAIGLATAKKASGNCSKTIAVIGDGALTGGLAYEAMNNINTELKDLIVVLNDNSMSISKSVGRVSQYLMGLRNTENYIQLKDNVKKVLHRVPVIGQPTETLITNLKTSFRRKLFDGTMFEEFGFNYVGPIDGHDLPEMTKIFSQLSRTSNGPYFVHVITQKGKGYTLAEKNPGAYHGVGSFDLEKGNPDISLADSFSNTFGRELNRIADQDQSVFAVTAAMKYGTGLQYFYHSHKDRFVDVGIAEEYAVTFSSGLAKGGKKPVFCVYSTFLQRCFDQLVHDICLNDSNILLAIDRAGFVGDDGETHQGIYDVALLSVLKNFHVVSPSNYSELIYWMNKLIRTSGPKAIRYPRGKEDQLLSDYVCTGKDWDLIRCPHDNAKTLIITYGRELAEVQKAANMLDGNGIHCDILKLNMIIPLPETAIDLIKTYKRVLFVEEGSYRGGIGEQLKATISTGPQFDIIAIDGNRIMQASVDRQKELYGLDANSIYRYLKETSDEKET